jgi:hypothetical protein
MTTGDPDRTISRYSELARAALRGEAIRDRASPSGPSATLRKYRRTAPDAVFAGPPPRCRKCGGLPSEQVPGSPPAETRQLALETTSWPVIPFWAWPGTGHR